MPLDRFFHPRAGHSEKVSALTHLEFRVWWTYVLAADDYGVMRASAVTIQALNDALAEVAPKTIEAALQRIVDLGLCLTFEHQNRRYLCDPRWQDFQNVRHPRSTIEPVPPPEIVRQFSGKTSELFRKRFGNESGEVQSLARAGRRETANATANANAEGVAATSSAPAPVAAETAAAAFRMDEAARELWQRYPESARVKVQLIERPLYAALTEDATVPQAEAFAKLLDRLEQHKRSTQWAVKRMVPRLDRWLHDGLHQQVLDEPETATETVDADEARRRAARERYADLLPSGGATVGSV